MYTIILGLLVIFATACRTEYRSWHSLRKNTAEITFYTVVHSFIFMPCVAAMAIALGLCMPEKLVSDPEQTIEACPRQASDSGCLVIVKTIASGASVYQFQVRNADSSVSLIELPASAIVQVTEHSILKNSGLYIIKRLEKDQTSFLENWTLGTTWRKKIARIELHVPAGTLIYK